MAPRGAKSRYKLFLYGPQAKNTFRSYKQFLKSSSSGQRPSGQQSIKYLSGPYRESLSSSVLGYKKAKKGRGRMSFHLTLTFLLSELLHFFFTMPINYFLIKA